MATETPEPKITATRALVFNTTPQPVVKTTIRGWDFAVPGTPMLFLDSVPDDASPGSMLVQLVKVGSPHPAGMTGLGVRRAPTGEFWELFVEA